VRHARIRRNDGGIVTLRVEVSAYLRRNLSDSNHMQDAEVAFREGLTVRQLVVELGISLEEVGVVTVNRTVVHMDQLLTDGDMVGVFPPALGG